MGAQVGHNSKLDIHFLSTSKEGMIKSCIHIMYEYSKDEHVNYEYMCWYLSYE